MVLFMSMFKMMEAEQENVTKKTRSIGIRM